MGTQPKIDDQTVVLVGSATSIFASEGAGTALPMGSVLAQTLQRKAIPELGDLEVAPANSLVAKTLDFSDRIKKVFFDLSRPPFERILEHYPDKEFLRKQIASTFQSPYFSAVHLHLLHKCLAVGADIITTNYDLGFENAAGDIPISVIVRQSDTVRDNQINLFKIHGCASDPASLVFDFSGRPHYEGEGRLPSWKRACLLDLIADKNLLIVGYSGRDFDVCPVLFSDDARAKSVTWVTRSSDQISPYARAMEQLGRVRLWTGSFQKLLPDMPTPLVCSESIQLASELAERWYGHLNETQKTVWRLDLGHTLNLDRLVHASLTESQFSQLPKAIQYIAKGDLDERLGRYKACYRNRRNAACILREEGDRESARLWNVRAVHALYTGGHFLRGLFALYRERISAFASRAARQEWQYGKLLFLKATVERLGGSAPPGLRACIVQGFRSVASAALERGDWHLCFLSITQLDRFSRDYDNRTERLLDSAQGFAQLGAVVSQIIAWRNLGSDFPGNEEELINTLQLLERLGMYPELRKWLINSPLLPASSPFKREYNRLVRGALEQIEYAEVSEIIVKRPARRALRAILQAH